MSPLSDTYVSARRALLDALQALQAQLDALILVGAQAIYIHTGDTDDAIATETTDGDLAVDPKRLSDAPLIEQALTDAGFHPNLLTNNPGEWLSADGVSIDLLVPEAVAQGSGSRSVELPPHSSRATRRVAGLEGALVDNDELEISSLDPGDDRAYPVRVAGPSALLVSKLHKISDRQDGPSHRRIRKDSHDVYRLLREVSLEDLAAGFRLLAADAISRGAAKEAVTQLQTLFGGLDSPGAVMAGETVEGVGNPVAVAESSAVLAAELLDDLNH